MTLSRTAHSGAKASESSSWKLEHSQTTIAAVAASPTSEARGVPTLPATATGSAAVRHRWPRSSVTVVLPFVPVTATKRFGSNRQASSSSSEDRRFPAGAAAATTGASAGNSGALDQAAGAFEQIDAIRFEVDLDARAAQVLRPLGRARVAARHPLSTAGQKPRGGLTRARQADDQVGAAGKGRSRLRHGPSFAPLGLHPAPRRRGRLGGVCIVSRRACAPAGAPSMTSPRTWLLSFIT